MTNFKLKEVINNSLKRELLESWRDENIKDFSVAADNSFIDKVRYYKVFIENDYIGWFAIGDYCKVLEQSLQPLIKGNKIQKKQGTGKKSLNSLLFVFIQPEFRKRGLFKEIISFSKENFNIEFLLSGLISEHFERFSKIYKEAGFGQHITLWPLWTPDNLKELISIRVPHYDCICQFFAINDNLRFEKIGFNDLFMLMSKDEYIEHHNKVNQEVDEYFDSNPTANALATKLTETIESYKR